MATKKPQARRTDEGISGWIWLFAAVTFTAAVFMVAPNLFSGLMMKNGDGFLRVTQQVTQKIPLSVLSEVHAYPTSLLPPPIAEEEDNLQTHNPAVESSSPTLNRYDFYTLLPGAEVLLSDAELAAITRAEHQRSSRALPTPIDEGERALVAQENQNRMVHPATVDGLSYAVQEVAPISPLPDIDNARYILQAGSFQTPSEAETVRAQLAMMGLLAQVEPAQINGNTLYRVRMGPYDSASDLNDARTKLRRSGLPSMAIRAQ